MTYNYQPELAAGFVAVAYEKDKDGPDYYDGCYTWETAQQFADDGYKVVAIQNDGAMEKDEIQRICDYRLTAAIDCFGEDYRK